MIKLLEIKAYKGRNIYSHQKVIRLIVDLENLKDTPTIHLNGFNEKLLRVLPGLKEHHCSLGYAGGFRERLMEGTYLAHVIEHMALAMLNEIGCPVSFGKAKQLKDSVYTVVFAYREERVSLETAKQAIAMVNAFILDQDYDLPSALIRLKEIAVNERLGPSTQAIVDAAIERGIPVTRLGGGGIIQLGYGKYHKKLECTLSDNASCIAVDISCDKPITKEMLKQSGIPVPVGQVCHSAEEAMEAAESIGYPVVVKPINGNQGRGVSLGLQSRQEVLSAYSIAVQVHETILVEETICGRDYRVLVVGNQVAAAALRVPAHVVGDGIHTIAYLIVLKNTDSRRGEDHEKPLSKIRLDEIALQLLAKQGYVSESIPNEGVMVYLKSNGNISTGGEAIDCTERIHPYNQEIAIRAARIIGLDIAGIDITCRDIGRPLSQDNGAVIEVNAAPGIRMHVYPSKGKARKVGDCIVDMLFPSGNRHSVPIVSVTGTNGKTTTTRMIAHMLRIHGQQVGMTTTDGIYINDKCIMKGDTTGPASAQALLMDKGVDAVVLETARGGILRSGLGYDLSDVGVLLNISEDHLGLDGVETLEDLLLVKVLVVEAVKTNGYAVLNADDPLVVRAADRVRANIIYFSRQENNLILHKHICEGGIAVFLKDGYITIATGNGLIQSISAAQIPATLGGRLLYNIENTLAAVSAAYGLKIPLAEIETGLTSFYGDEIHNPGRFNIYNILDYRVIVDYGHNIAGIEQVTQAIKKMGASRLVGIIGVPGDRDDMTIRRIGRIAGQAFERIYIKEDLDGRGREKGETAALLLEGSLEAGMHKSRAVIILSETEALKTAMSQATCGDIIVVFYEHLEPIQCLLNDAIQTNACSESERMILKA